MTLGRAGSLSFYWVELPRDPCGSNTLALAPLPRTAHMLLASVFPVARCSRFAVLPIGEDNGIVEWVLSTAGLRHCIVSTAGWRLEVGGWRPPPPSPRPCGRSGVEVASSAQPALLLREAAGAPAASLRAHFFPPACAHLAPPAAPQSDMYTASGQLDGRTNRIIQKIYESAPPVGALHTRIAVWLPLAAVLVSVLVRARSLVG